MVEDHISNARLSRPITQQVVSRVMLQIAPHPHPQMTNDDVMRPVYEPYAPVALRLGIADDRPWLYDATTGVRAPDRTELQQALTGAETRVREAEAQVRAAAQARAALEARVRALEERLRRRQG